MAAVIWFVPRVRNWIALGWWRHRAGLEQRSSDRDQHLNEFVELTTCENRHLGCVQPGETIAECEDGKVRIPLGPCTWCGERPGNLRSKRKA